MTATNLVLGLALACAAVLVVPSILGPVRGRIGFALAIVVALVAGRWEALTDNQPWGNPDEGHLLAGALTLAHDPVFWRSVDGTTHGPVDLWPLTFVSWIGLTLDYRAARILAVACTAGMILLLWRLVARRSEAAGRIAVLPATAWLALTREPEFHQLCSEHVPMLLIAMATKTAFAESPGGFSERRAAWLGVLLAALPFAKLQAVPVAAAIGGTWLWSTRETGSRQLLLLRSAFLGGAVALAIVLAPTLLAGLGGEFWTSYIVANRNYAMVGPLNPPGPRLIWGLQWLLAITGGALVAALLADRRGLLGNRYLPEGAALTVAAVLAIRFPGHPFQHYWLLAAPGIILLAGAAAPVLLGRERIPQGWLPALALVVMLPFALKRLQAFPRFEEFRAARPQIGATALAAIREQVPADGSLAIWGWLPDLYVLTQRPQAVREAQTGAEINPGPLQARFRARYLADLERRRPEVFVDAVHPGAFAFTDRACQGHETFPDLSAWLARDYAPAGEFDGLRLYRRKDP